MKKPLFLITSFTLGMAQTTIAGDLLAWWNFDTLATGKSVDIQSGYIGQLLNGAQYTTPGTGRSGTGGDRGMLFGNGQHRIYVPNATFLNDAGAVNAVSVSFWQNLGEQRDQLTFYAEVPGIAQAFAAHSPWSDGQIYWDTGGCCDGATQRIQVAPGVSWLIAPLWHHIVLTKNGDTKRIYLDGAEIATGINTAPIPTTFTDMYIGNHKNANNAISGILDDFAIFKRELTPTEVAALYGGASPGSLEADNDTDTDGLPDQWELRFAASLAVIQGSGMDTDTDGLADEAELALGTNPNNGDTDADGAPDGSETSTGVWVSATNRGTSPFIPDTDKDGLLDGVETNTGTFVDATNTGSNPHLSDTDNDGAPDGFEVTKLTNPSDPNSVPLLWTVRNVISGAGLNSIASVNNLFGPTGSITAQTTTSETVINFDENVGGGGAPFQPQNAFPAIGTMGTDTNGFAIKATGRISITAPGLYTFGFSSDDGGGLYIDGAPVVVFDADRGTGTSLGVVNLAVGSHKVEFLFWENGGGAQCQVFVANTRGDFTASGTDNATIQANYHLLETSVFDTTDSDSDGLPDIYEESFFPGDLAKLGAGDFDSDTINDPAEYTNGTDPTKADTDDDGLSDSQEVVAGTNPVNADTDGDGLLDGAENKTGIFVNFLNTGTNPLVVDTDGDKWSDGVEVGWPSDPNIKASQPSVSPGKLDLLAFWDFNDNSKPASSLDLIHGWKADFLGGTTYTPAGEGAHGTPGDRAMNMGTAGGLNGANVANASWFGLGVTDPITFNNLGSLGADGNLQQGAATPGQPGALAAEDNASMSTLPPNGATIVPYRPELNPNGSFTAEAWFNPGSQQTGGGLLCSLSSGFFASPRTGWLIYQSASGWNFRTYYNDGFSTSVNITGNNGAPPVAGVWTHVVVKWNSVTGEGSVYVDGVHRITSNPGRPYVPGATNGRFCVGARSDNAFQWPGGIDEVAFYNTALSDAEILSHYQNAINPAPAQSYESLVLASNPVGYWRMTLSSLDPRGPDQVAVSFWQKQLAAGDSSSFWAHSPSSNNGERGFQAHVPWGDGQIYFDTAGCCDGTQRLVVGGGISLEQWHHYVFQKDGGHKEIWKDGVKISEGDGFAFLPKDFYKLSIGSAQNGGGAQRGVIDDFAVFGDSLSPAQISLLASGGSPMSLLPYELEFTQFSPNTPRANQISLTWNSRPGRTYVLFANQSLDPLTWFEIDDNIPSAGNSTSIVHDLLTTYPAGTRRVFYMVEENP